VQAGDLIFEVRQWVEIYRRIHGNDKSGDRTNEGGADF
jgi:hypothetical protein